MSMPCWISAKTLILLALAVSFITVAGQSFPEEGEEMAVQLPPTPKFTPPHLSGDRDFDGNGPRVEAWAEVTAKGGEIWVSVYMRAQETQSDFTEAAGTASYLLCRLPYQSCSIVSSAHSRHRYTDSDHEDDRFSLPPAELVKTFICVGDTYGNESGERTGVSVEFNPVIVLVGKERSEGEEILSTPYPNAFFKTSHNSYSGGNKGTLEDQMNSGIRGIELDFHDDAVQTDDFRVGHWYPGHEVAHDGKNPASDRLRDWLRFIRSWSDEHPGHSPITLFLDIKDDLTDNPAGYGYDRMNSMIAEEFGAALYRRSALQGNNWPSLEELAGRVLIVLTGHSKSKSDYWQKLPIAEQSSFVAFTYGQDHDLSLLNEARFVNIGFAYLEDPGKAQEWWNAQLSSGKIGRIYEYGEEAKKIWPEIRCHFPATDYPYRAWYADDFAYAAHYAKCICGCGDHAHGGR